MPDFPGSVDWTAQPAWFDVVGLVGIVFAIYQLLRSKGALKAARETYDETRSALAAAQILAAIPDLASASSELDSVLSDSDPAGAARPMRLFTKTAVALSELLSIASGDHEEVANQLRSVADDVSAAQAELYSLVIAPPNREAVGEAASQMRKTVISLQGVATRLTHTPSSSKRKG